MRSELPTLVSSECVVSWLKVGILLVVHSVSRGLLIVRPLWSHFYLSAFVLYTLTTGTGRSV